jgi:hypothetical protein
MGRGVAVVTAGARCGVRRRAAAHFQFLPVHFRFPVFPFLFQVHGNDQHKHQDADDQKRPRHHESTELSKPRRHATPSCNRLRWFVVNGWRFARNTPALRRRLTSRARQRRVPHPDSTLFQMNQQQRNARRGDAGNAACHAQGFRPVARELLARLDRQGRHLHIVQVGGQLQALDSARRAGLRLSGDRYNRRTWPQSPPARSPARSARQARLATPQPTHGHRHPSTSARRRSHSGDGATRTGCIRDRSPCPAPARIPQAASCAD